MQLWSFLTTFWTGILLYTGLRSSDATLMDDYQNAVSNNNRIVQENDHLINPSIQQYVKDRDIFYDDGKTIENYPYGPFHGKEVENSYLLSMNDFSATRERRSIPYDIQKEGVNEHSIIDLDLDNTCSFDLNIANYVNIKYNKVEMNYNTLLKEILERASEIKDLPSEKTLDKNIKSAFRNPKVNCAGVERNQRLCKVVKMEKFLDYSGGKYKLSNDETSFTKNEHCKNHSEFNLINRNSILCNAVSFYDVFNTKPIFDIKFNQRYLETDTFVRQVSAVLSNLREEILNNITLKRFLFRKHYPKVIRVLNHLYEAMNDIGYFEKLYKSYSPFAREKIDAEYDLTKKIAAKFFDYVVLNNNHQESEYETEDVVKLISYLEKRRLMYNIGNPKIVVSDIHLSIYLHVILSFVASFAE
ncbi:hypothetical protein NGRA_1834 [Nosema granulosis]|uniref:Uncharacterized protein n=1 Tax=Nosema granulosis TaxID=83296 RepID=A0A9P6GY79_9MICR|nr:hypothetical protein NGRA_1834 [Nosema granulosis]